jgi:hypothetical protein
MGNWLIKRQTDELTANRNRYALCAVAARYWPDPEISR